MLDITTAITHVARFRLSYFYPSNIFIYCVLVRLKVHVSSHLVFQVRLLPPEGASELSVAIREFLPLCLTPQETYLPWATSRTPHTLSSQLTADGCALAAFPARVAA